MLKSGSLSLNDGLSEPSSKADPLDTVSFDHIEAPATIKQEMNYWTDEASDDSLIEKPSFRNHATQQHHLLVLSFLPSFSYQLSHQ